MKSRIGEWIASAITVVLFVGGQLLVSTYRDLGSFLADLSTFLRTEWVVLTAIAMYAILMIVSTRLVISRLKRIEGQLPQSHEEKKAGFEVEVSPVLKEFFTKTK